MKKTATFRSVLALLLVMTLVLSTLVLPASAQDWTQTMGNTYQPGVTDAKLPTSAEQMEEKWAWKTATGWGNSAGTPIEVGDYWYLGSTAQKTLYKLNKGGKEVVAQAELPSKGQYFCQIAYGDGQIFVPVEKSDGVYMYSYDADTLELLWVSEKFPSNRSWSQALCPAIYYNGYVYCGNDMGNGKDGSYVAISTAVDENTTPDEPRAFAWTYQPENTDQTGYYWAGAAVVGNALVFAGDSGEIVSHSLTQDLVYDRYVVEDATGAMFRSVACYDPYTQRVFLTARDTGSIYSLRVNSDGTFDRDSFLETKLESNVTSSPAVYRGRVYVGNGGQGSTGKVSVLDAETLELLYQVDLLTQTSPIITTAYATPENGYQVYVYFMQYNSNDNGIYVLADSQNNNGENPGTLTKLITPSVKQYTTSNVVAFSDGTMYCYNDSGNLFCFGWKDPQDAQYTVQDVENAIDCLPDPENLTLLEQYDLQRAKERFDALTSQEQAQVSSGEKLQALVEKMTQLKNEANQVQSLIEEIGALDVSSLTLEQEALVNDLQSRYNALSADAKAQVTNYNLLEQAVAKIQELRTQQTVSQLEGDIAALKPVEEMTYAQDFTQVEGLYKQYTGLSAQDQALVTNGETLVQAYEQLKALGEEITSLNQAIWDQILPMELTREDQETVDALTQRYNALSPEDQELVTNRGDLFYAQRVLEKLQKNILSQELLEMIQDLDSYQVQGITQEGVAYQVALNPSSLNSLEDLNFDLSLTSAYESAMAKLAKDPLALSFANKGAFPCALTVTLPVDLADGTYGLYAFDAQGQTAKMVQKVQVSNGVATFTVEQGGEYFLAGALNGSDNANTGDSMPLAGVMGLLLLSAGAALLLKRRTSIQ